ncbi:exosortase C-terminal domain/associated protein EpsI [Salidesulfovibrio brasiliensis]
MMYRYLFVYALLIAAGLYTHLHSDVATPLSRSLDEFPMSVDEWRAVKEWHFSEPVMRVLRPSDYLARKYRSQEGDTVELYIGYHNGGPDAGPVHSPKHCMPGSGWLLESQQQRTITVDGDPLKVVWAVYRKGERRDVFVYWFQVCGNPVVSEYALKLGEVLGSLTKKRRDSAFIRISTSGAGEGAPTEMLSAFVTDFYPVIRAYLPG